MLTLQLLYLPIVGLGTSLRGFAPVVPGTMLCVGLLLGAIRPSMTGRVPRAAGLLAAVLITALAWRWWWPDDRAFVQTSIAGYEWRRAVEIELRAQGVTAPLQVFGDAGFHFVLHPGPGWYSYLPRSNGGWPRLDLYGLDRLAPEIRADSLDAFVEDCRRNGITHIVIGATIGALQPELGELFAGQRAHPGLTRTATVAGFAVFAVTR